MILNILFIGFGKSVETFKNNLLGIQLQGMDFDQGYTINLYKMINSPIKGENF
jgi:hypothetical protein